ncbi:hypothetical protein [Paracoccus sp. MKU1]|uniref:hypothetical protein n=1 Tax=Paracoccus sp. MKU1 TaxID=1745182 RepID=UPI0007193385|nr:hypothetical protein [Paracoccus sp. MKU1]KRW94355.1 hypothetical protein AQY21_20715 [Paracoccus sp. MKU1]
MTPEPTRHTVRERIMQAIQARFESAPAQPGDISWGLVTRKPITKSDIANENFALGLYDTSERIKEGTGWEMHFLNVVLEFHVRIHEGDEPSTFLNHCLGQVSTRIGEDITWGGLAINTRESGSELDIDGAFDKYVSGILVVDVSYRCRPNDPYTRV